MVCYVDPSGKPCLETVWEKGKNTSGERLNHPSITVYHRGQSRPGEEWKHISHGEKPPVLSFALFPMKYSPVLIPLMPHVCSLFWRGCKCLLLNRSSCSSLAAGVRVRGSAQCLHDPHAPRTQLRHHQVPLQQAVPGLSQDPEGGVPAEHVAALRLRRP